MVVFTYDSSRSLCAICFNPAAQVWITETGYSTWRHDERRQLTAFVDAIDAPVDRVYWYAMHDLDPALPTPPGWRAYVTEVLGATAPHRMTDGRTPAYRDWSEGYDPASWLDRAINATRESVFPLHGLDPLP